MFANKYNKLDAYCTSSQSNLLMTTFNGMNNWDILKEWVYRGEGNSSIVISIPNTRQILRIRKTDKSKSYFEHCMESLMDYFQTESSAASPDGHFHKKILAKSFAHKFKSIVGNIVDWCFHMLDIEYNNAANNAEISLKFYERIVVPLLGVAYTSDAKLIDLSKREVTLLEKEIHKLRPDFRKTKRLSYGKATLFADYAFLPKQSEESLKVSGATYAVEIKPKQGWIPLSKQGHKKCQFCTNQFLKQQKQEIQEISQYCPLDLYSGDEMRMKKAICALIASPQNNFRLFRNGHLVYGDSLSLDAFNNAIRQMFDVDNDANTENLLSEFTALLIKALTEPLANEGCDDHVCTLTEDAVCSSEASKLPKGCVLEKILSMQKFDRLGLQNYERYFKHLDGAKSEYTYVESLLEELDAAKCPKCLIERYVCQNVDNHAGTKDVNRSHSVLNLVPYLVAAVVCDCSLMVTFKKSSGSDNSEHFTVPTSYGDYVANVGVFDLYPKPLSTIPKHVIRDLTLRRISKQH